MLLVVKIEHKRKLLLRRAERVGTVGTRSTVSIDTVTRDFVADVVKQSLVVSRGDIAGNNAGKGVKHTLANTLVRSGRQVAGSLPVSKSGSGASTGNGVGRGPRVGVNPAGAHRLKTARQVGEVGKGGDGIVGDGNETVVVVLLKVHVDDTTGPDISHVAGVEGRNVGKSTRLGNVATVFGEEDRDGKVSKFLSTGFVTRGFKVDGGTTPFIHVNSVKVSGFRGVTAGEVVSKVSTGVGVIISRVTDGDGTVVLVSNVSLCITNSGLDERRSISVSVVVSDLVTGKETEDV